MRILAICPSNRPELLDRTLNSFEETKTEKTDISINREDKSITKIFNETFEKNPDYDFYFMANDDIIFKTKGWDSKLANKGKISWGFDGIQENSLCCFPMIDGDIVRALGWLQMPLLDKYCGDVVWRCIGKDLGILNYMPEVEIIHDWQGCANPDVNVSDMSKFAKWLPNSHKDIAKVKAVLK